MDVKKAIIVLISKTTADSARASRFIVHFFVVTTRLQREILILRFSNGGRQQATIKLSLNSSLAFDKLGELE